MDKNDKIKLNAIKKRWLGRKRFGQHQKGMAEFGPYKDVGTLIELIEKLDAKVLNSLDLDAIANIDSALL